MLDAKTNLQIKLTRKYLKLKIVEDNVSFRGHNLERQHTFDLVKRTLVNGESHSALILGPRGSGKTTLMNSVLTELSKQVDIKNDAMVIKLNGLIHHDDKIALNSITAQMQLENVVGDRVFGTFAENFSFLLSCLRSGSDRQCKSMLFILDEFDMFCHVGRTQTLLYNLFDITHNKMAPVCVIGITSRLDVTELLEKRVKSRFSHRQILLLQTEDTEIEINDQLRQKSPMDIHIEIFVNLLSLPTVGKAEGDTKGKRRGSRKSSSTSMETDRDVDFTIPEEVLARCDVDAAIFDEFDDDFVLKWNEHVKGLTEDRTVLDAMKNFCHFSSNERLFRNVLLQIVSKLSVAKPSIEPVVVAWAIDKEIAPEHRVALLKSLSILELCLVIAMKHGIEIFDGQPMNFEMVLHRYTKFASSNSSSQTVPRPVILKAFEHLQTLRLIVQARNDSMYGHQTTASRVQKEYQLFHLVPTATDIEQALKGFKALPTEIQHWYNSDSF